MRGEGSKSKVKNIHVKRWGSFIDYVTCDIGGRGGGEEEGVKMLENLV